MNRPNNPYTMPIRSERMYPPDKLHSAVCYSTDKPCRSDMKYSRFVQLTSTNPVHIVRLQSAQSSSTDSAIRADKSYRRMHRAERRNRRRKEQRWPYECLDNSCRRDRKYRTMRRPQRSCPKNTSMHSNRTSPDKSYRTHTQCTRRHHPKHTRRSRMPSPSPSSWTDRRSRADTRCRGPS